MIVRKIKAKSRYAARTLLSAITAIIFNYQFVQYNSKPSTCALYLAVPHLLFLLRKTVLLLILSVISVDNSMA